MLDRQQFVKDCSAVRGISPIILNITNYVAMNISANALLAIGASPLMSSCQQEIKELVALSDALVINIGCLDCLQIEAMETAAEEASRLGKPWVLDPVGAGASRLRTETALRLISRYSPNIIRCNASEILSLATEYTGKIPTASKQDQEQSERKCRGVDSACASYEVVKHAAAFASKAGAVVSVSGQTDYITDGVRIECISNGHPVMPRVTAMGCTASSITAAFAAAGRNSFEAALHAMALMGTVGEKAVSKCKELYGNVGAGSFQMHFLDMLTNSEAEELAGMIRQ